MTQQVPDPAPVEQAFGPDADASSDDYLTEQLPTAGDERDHTVSLEDIPDDDGFEEGLVDLP